MITVRKSLSGAEKIIIFCTGMAFVPPSAETVITWRMIHYTDFVPIPIAATDFILPVPTKPIQTFFVMLAERCRQIARKPTEKPENEVRK